MAERLLEVKNLKVQFATEDGIVQAVDDISFELERGKVLGIVGESGSGKSVTSMTLMGLTRGVNARFRGEVLYKGTDLLKVSDRDMQNYRGNELGMIFQDPMTSLNPVYRIGDQIIEAIQAHEKVGKRAARARTVELLRQVGIPNPETRVDDYPHQFSGGMRQRAMIALALSCNPSVLLADEPTTALDVTVQIQILLLLRELQRELGMAVIFVTHDVGAAVEISDRLAVMYAGRFVETGTARDVLKRHAHPYTEGLLAANLHDAEPGARLMTIPGSPPSSTTPRSVMSSSASWWTTRSVPSGNTSRKSIWCAARDASSAATPSACMSTPVPRNRLSCLDCSRSASARSRAASAAPKWASRTDSTSIAWYRLSWSCPGIMASARSQ